jgi:hypothetical protein
MATSGKGTGVVGYNVQAAVDTRPAKVFVWLDLAIVNRLERLRQPDEDLMR